LTKLYRIHCSQTPIPIERYIINFMDEVPTPDVGNILVQMDLGNQTFHFFRPIDQNPPYAGQKEIESLFWAMDFEQVINLFLSVLLEKQVVLISKSRTLLMNASVAI
jgi:hypothetical protein